MNRDDIEHLWFQAMHESVEAGEPYIRHRFAALVAAAEREACAKVADEWQTEVDDPRYQCDCAAAIRKRGEV
jgi:hypothetical protein